MTQTLVDQQRPKRKIAKGEEVIDKFTCNCVLFIMPIILSIASVRIRGMLETTI